MHSFFYGTMELGSDNMKKIAGIEYILIGLVIVFILMGPIEAYRISTTYFNMELEQSYIYETTLIGVPLALFLIYVIAYVKYKKHFSQRGFVLTRLFYPLVLSWYIIGYLLGLNWENFKGTIDAFEYEFVLPFWGMLVFNLLFMLFNVVLFGFGYKMKKYHMALNIYSVILVIFYILMFSMLINDSAAHLGLFSWIY